MEIELWLQYINLILNWVFSMFHKLLILMKISSNRKKTVNQKKKKIIIYIYIITIKW